MPDSHQTEANLRAMAARLLDSYSRPGKRLDDVTRREDFHRLPQRDRSLLMELLHGATRWRGRLDHWIGLLSDRPVDQLDRMVVWTLRLALYQIEHLRVPEHAAVHQAVDACRALGIAKASGFVNAILRSFLRDRPKPPSGYRVPAMAARWSHPEWLVRRWAARFGDRTADRLLRRNNERPRGYLWLNPKRTDPEAFSRLLDQEAISHEVLPDGTITVDDRMFVHHDLYRRGLCAYMDRSSQRVARLADVKGCLRVGDLCCAPGGKAMDLAARLDQEAVLHCGDASLSRLRETRLRMRRLGYEDATFSCGDWEAGRTFRPVFDLVLLDVPCSGLGTLRSNPDIRWTIREEDLKGYGRRQSRMLAQAFDTLRPGGRLLYSTCSTEPEENEDVVESLLASHPNAKRLEEDFRTFPEDVEGDGFYAALIGHR